jgi:hypothetical protein
MYYLSQTCGSQVKDLESHKNYYEKRRVWKQFDLGDLEEMDQNNSCPAIHRNICLAWHLYATPEGQMLL